MLLNSKNQNDILQSFELEFEYENKPINRIKKPLEQLDKSVLLKKLEKEINEIKECELKKNSNNLVFSDGDFNSPVMIVGEGPGQREDELGKPFVGEAGLLLNKMLNAINIHRNKIYITNVVNFRPPNNRKPEKSEINRYSYYLRKHISIINPKILILLGSTAMESLLGSNVKISKIRGTWKEIIINDKVYNSIVTFHPAYLLRQPDQKKYSWLDLKEIKKKIDLINIKL
ncbi:uracil-DNA glycosylase [Candidatus Pelagibacter sp.]|nr:uracil-DNA glycosylase [Candidatus Pelagibacter sp.]